MHGICARLRVITRSAACALRAGAAARVRLLELPAQQLVGRGGGKGGLPASMALQPNRRALMC